MRALLFILVLAANLTAKDFYTLKEVTLEGDLIVDTVTKKPISSTLKSFYKSGELFSVVPVVGGRENGVEKIYYKSGELMFETPYRDGKADGVKKGYYKNGRIKSLSVYKEGVENGVRKIFYENGNLLSEVPVVNGKKNGVAKIYLKDGTLKAARRFKNDKALPDPNRSENEERQ
jgi:antitoxin component YwqK of YwqJK toxin-antitoxin module